MYDEDRPGIGLLLMTVLVAAGLMLWIVAILAVASIIDGVALEPSQVSDEAYLPGEER